MKNWNKNKDNSKKVKKHYLNLEENIKSSTQDQIKPLTNSKMS